jgi:hypothetical protein
MRRKALAEFDASFPQDCVENDEDIEIFGGRLASEAIAGILRKAGYDVSSPRHAHEHGWDFEVRVGGRRIWVQVTRLDDDYILIAEALVGVFERTFKKMDYSYYRQFLVDLNTGLAADARFKPAKWYRFGERGQYGDPEHDPLSVL